MGYLLGIDGGATGTIAVLAEEDGTLKAVARAGASNHLVVGKENTKAALQSVIQSVLEAQSAQLDDCVLTTCGLAALGSKEDRAVYEEILNEIGIGGDVIIESDVVIAWAAATEGKPGIGVIAGTGSSCFGVNAAGKRMRALGWDYQLADQGSGYWIGSQGLKTAMKVYDRRIPKSSLLDAMVSHYNLSSANDILNVAYEEGFGKEQIAGFAAEVARCAAEGDNYAIQIMYSAAQELGEAVIAVARELDMLKEEFPVGLIGGVFRSGELILEPLREYVLAQVEGAQIEVASYPAVLGALILGQSQTLEDAIPGEFLNNLESSYKSMKDNQEWK